jgi:tRNA threonylcarbamoyl adenosine modification protein YeaZ
MKMYLDTSTPTTILRLDEKEYTWESGRDLAENLHAFIRDKLKENDADFSDISEIVFMSGPGSFTGLRIGAAVVNALASELNVPLFDHLGNKVPVILPIYDRPANISSPRK